MAQNDNDKQLSTCDVEQPNIAIDARNVVNSLISAKAETEVKDLTGQFNLLIAKKNALRLLKMEQLLDAVTDQMASRVEKRPDEFDNRDLLSYFDSIQKSLDRCQKQVNQVDDNPVITYNTQNNQVNIIANSENEGLSREQKENVIAAVQAYLKNAQRAAQQNKQSADNAEKEESDGDKQHNT